MHPTSTTPAPWPALLLATGLFVSGCPEDEFADPDAAASDAGVDGGSEVEPCMVEAPTECPTPMPTYDDVEPIFRMRCLGCHNGHLGPWPLTSYSHVADWHDTIRGQILACTMPPPDAGSQITNAERLEILEWLRCGYPR